MFQFLAPLLAGIGKAAAVGGKAALAGGKAVGKAAKPMFGAGQSLGGFSRGSIGTPGMPGYQEWDDILTPYGPVQRGHGDPVMGGVKASGGNGRMMMDYLGSMMQGGGMPQGQGQQQASPSYDISQAFSLDPYQMSMYQVPQGGGIPMPDYIPLSSKKGRYY